MPCDYQELPHEGIRSLTPYIPGKSAEALADEQGLTNIIKLASNENPLGCSLNVIHALSELTIKNISTYPLAASHPIRQKLSKKLNVHCDMLTLANGSDALIPLLQTCFALHSDRHIITHEYAFIAYRIYANSLGIPVRTTPLQANWEVDIDAMIKACNQKTALIFIATPNNPTGLLLKQPDILRLLQHIPTSTLLVIDEAYHEYVAVSDKLTTIALLATYPNLVILRTFSKAYGLAGLRLGYAISNQVISAILHRVLPPFAVNQASLIAANAALDDDDFIKRSIQLNHKGTEQLVSGLTELGLSHLPTAGNFIAVNYKKNALPLYQYLLSCGIIVRPLQPYGLDNFLRVTIGTEEQNSRFLNALRDNIHR